MGSFILETYIGWTSITAKVDEVGAQAGGQTVTASTCMPGALTTTTGTSIAELPTALYLMF